MWTVRSFATCAVLVSAVLFLPACTQLRNLTSTEADLFAVDIDGVDFDGEQLPARILLSDPQIFARETLVNDRRREVKHIRKLITESPELKFTPQLIRDVQHIAFLAGQLGVGFDPTVGMQNQQLVGRQNVLNQIETTRLEGELLRVENQLRDLQAGQGAGPGAPQTTTAETVTAPPTADIEAVTKQLTDLIDTVKDLLRIGQEARKTDVEQSPEDRFRDLQAYRNELRAAEAAEDLDDVHDLDGNTLYRLQMRATVLPGKETDRFGIAMVDVQPPELGNAELERLYFDWLTHVTQRLNICGLKKNGEPFIDSDIYYERLGMGSGLYGVVRLPVGLFGTAAQQLSLDDDGIEKIIEKTQTIRIAVHPEVQENLQDIACERMKLGKNKTPWCEKNWPKDKESARTSGSAKEPSEYFGDIARMSLETAFFAFKGLAKLGDCVDLLDPLMLSMRKFMEELLRIGDNIEGTKLLATIPFTLTLPSVYIAPPPLFSEEIGAPSPTCLRGESFAYASMPVQRVQRLSTVAGAANALQMSMAMSASLPTQGLSLRGGVASLQAASGKISALERAPLVIGFTDRDVKTASCPGQEVRNARFGWVFGPPVRIDPNENKLILRHVVATHQVMADISVPAWWPYVTLKARSAWIGNWNIPADQSSTKLLDRYMSTDSNGERTPCGKQLPGYFCEPIKVKLPASSADWRSLTDYLARNVLRRPLRQPSIDSVEPQAVNACAGKVRIQVIGTDLWRGTQAYLHGQKGTDFEVLPSMSGIAVTFDLRKIRPARIGQKPVKLIVWTRDGPVAKMVTLKEEPKGCKPKSPTGQAVAADEKVVYPTKVSFQYDKSNKQASLELKIGELVPEIYKGFGLASAKDIEIEADLFDTDGKGIAQVDATATFPKSLEWAGQTIKVVVPRPKKEWKQFCDTLKDDGVVVMLRFKSKKVKKLPPIKPNPTLKGSCT